MLFRSTRLGARFLFKHAPDCAFFAEDDLVQKFERVFEEQLMLADALGDVHAMVIATFSVAKAGYPVLREIGMMLVTASWIPFETMRDYQLVTALTETGRAFLKSQRFTLGRDVPIAAAVLTDLQSPVSLFTAEPSAEADEIAALREVAAEGTYPAWLWIEEDAKPELPERNGGHSGRLAELSRNDRRSSGGNWEHQRSGRVPSEDTAKSGEHN